MNWLDIAIIATAIIFGFIGFSRGAIRAAFGIAGLIGGIALAGHYYGGLADVLFPDGAVWAPIAAYAIIVVATMVVASIIGRVVSHLADIIMLGWVDRLIGLVLGVAVGSILWAAALAITSKYLPGVAGAMSDSAVARFVMGQFPLLLALLPEEFDFIRDFLAPSGQVY
jgi:membrane protein required for colicin V production